ncbi:MAG TPA: DUF4276 family protein [Chromatiales bacterium]|nr:DUF4276 family protein [Chromatiales bacterium]
MSGVTVYMEGGGDSKDTKAALRQGMGDFLAPLRDNARRKSWRWKLVCCGGRDAAFKGFRNAVQNGDNAIVVLLVDAEAPVNSPNRVHLQSRDSWDLQFASDDLVHLMVQTMEAWIVADPDALNAYYGHRFRENVLPRTQNLEMVSKTAIASALEEATRDTQKGKYHKIRHASDLLKRIDQQKVQQRCPGCALMFDVLGQAIQGA